MGPVERCVAENGIGIVGEKITRSDLMRFANVIDSTISDLEKRCVRVDPTGHLVDEWNRPDKTRDQHGKDA